VAWYLGPVVVFGLVPALDLLTGLDRSNPPDEVIEALENDRYYRWVTFGFLPIQYAGLVLACRLVATGDLSVAAVTGLTLTVGVISGVGINTAHELGHKRETVERWLAKVALAPSWYGHFYIEHNRGHHVRVATPEDPASSRLGETVYDFLPRTITGSVVSAWDLERRRITRRRRHPFTLGNDILNSWLMSAVLWGSLVAAFGPRAPCSSGRQSSLCCSRSSTTSSAQHQKTSARPRGPLHPPGVTSR
jgi:alkane 1-monooxygenase